MYSQSLRLRRIINSKERLGKRLHELAESFKEGGYPTKMVKEITSKVLNSERDISVKHKEKKENQEKIVVVSTYQADKNIVEAVTDCEENLKRTQSFRDQHGPLFKFVKKVGPNIKTHMNTLKHQALGIKQGSAEKCGSQGCNTCHMIMKVQFVRINQKKV